MLDDHGGMPSHGTPRICSAGENWLGWFDSGWRSRSGDQCARHLHGAHYAAGAASSGLTISFSGQIPVFSGNGIPFRNFDKFRRISLNFGRNLLNFEFENEKYRNFESR